MNHFLSSLCLLLLFLSACADREAPEVPDTTEPQIAENIAAVVGERAQRLFGNDFVEVMRVELAPGDSLPPHRGADRVVYALSDYTIRFQQRSQRTTRSHAEGEAHFHEAGVHAVENVGSAPAVFVVFERGTAALPEAPAASEATDLDAQAGPTEVETLVENPSAEAHLVTLGPGEQLPPHTGYARIVYSLSDYAVVFHEGDRQEERSFQMGDVHYHEPGRHWVENAGETPARFLVVEFRPR